METARSKGRPIGRPQMTVGSIPAIFLRHYPAYKKQLNISELARVCDLSRTTIYKYIALLEGERSPREPLRFSGHCALFGK